MAGTCPGKGTPQDIDIMSNRRSSHCSSRSDLSEDDISDSEIEGAVEVEAIFNLTIHWHGKTVELPFYEEDATIQDLSDAVRDVLKVPSAHQKFLITPRTGLLKPPFKDPSITLRSLESKKIVLMGATVLEAEEIQNSVQESRSRIERRQAALHAGRRVKAVKNRDWKKVQDEARYTFHTIQPLPYLPNPEKSKRFLERLRDDAGIKASMRKHGFSVGLLTEMNPAEHTTHESRTLGLNRNKGEVIELRLRTDAYDGYRDYKVIRKTLCHELAHNVWGEHDQHFWKLCREIEAEVDKNDYRRGGHTVGAQEFYNPEDDGESECHGTFLGETYVLGGDAAQVAAPTEPHSRREIIARATEERIKRQHEAKAKENDDSTK